MEYLLKRHFWVLNLVGLAVIAWLLAGVANGFVGMKLASSSVVRLDVAGDDGAGGTRFDRHLARARVGRDSGGAMASRSPFLIEEFAPEPVVEVAEEEPTEEDGADTPVEPTYAVTKLPIKLLGTMVVIPATFSSATVTVERTPDLKIVTVGTDLLDGQAKVHAIERTYIVLKESAALTIAPLWPHMEVEEDKGRTVSTVAPTRPAQVASAGGVDGIRRISDTSYQMDRDMINRKLKNLSSLGSQARVVPNYHNGKYDGFRMIGMQGDSLFTGIGFVNGDIVKVINGNRIDSPNKALALYEALKNKSRLTVQIERGGIMKTMRYIVR